MKTCNHCQQEKELHNFCIDYRSIETKYRNICKKCAVQQNKALRHENAEAYNKKAQEKRLARKVRAVEYKGAICQHCKQSYPPAVFDFHHVNPKEKDKDPGLMMSCSDEKLFIELDKCILLCANCHRIHHSKEGYV